jgi:hypothetical protein
MLKGIQFVLLGWLSVTFGEKVGLGETCEGSSNCYSGHCVHECMSSDSVQRCIEPKSFFKHLEIDVPSCINAQVARVLNNYIPGARADLGQDCAVHGDCFSGNCAPLCDKANTSNRCIEPVFSFNRYMKHVPTCISEMASRDHLLLLQFTEEESDDEADESESDENVDTYEGKETPVVPKQWMGNPTNSPTSDNKTKREKNHEMSPNQNEAIKDMFGAHKGAVLKLKVNEAMRSDRFKAAVKQQFLRGKK